MVTPQFLSAPALYRLLACVNDQAAQCVRGKCVAVICHLVLEQATHAFCITDTAYKFCQWHFCCGENHVLSAAMPQRLSIFLQPEPNAQQQAPAAALHSSCEAYQPVCERHCVISVLLHLQQQATTGVRHFSTWHLLRASAKSCFLVKQQIGSEPAVLRCEPCWSVPVVPVPLKCSACQACMRRCTHDWLCAAVCSAQRYKVSIIPCLACVLELVCTPQQHVAACVH